MGIDDGRPQGGETFGSGIVIVDDVVFIKSGLLLWKFYVLVLFCLFVCDWICFIYVTYYEIKVYRSSFELIYSKNLKQSDENLQLWISGW